MQGLISNLDQALKLAQTYRNVLKKPYWVLRSPGLKDGMPSVVTYVVISKEELHLDPNPKIFEDFIIEERIA